MLESATKDLELAHHALTTGQPNLASLYMARSLGHLSAHRDGGASNVA